MLEDASNVTVQLHANAVEIETDASGQHVERIHAATLDGNRFTVTARTFVIATGAIENARLLLASDRIQPNGVGNDHDLLGRYFQEHPRFDAGLILPTDPRMRIGFYEPHQVGKTTILGYLTLSSATARTEQLANVQVRLTPIYDPAVAAALDSSDNVIARDLLDRIQRFGGLTDLTEGIGPDLAKLAADLMSWERAVIPGGPIAVPLPEVVDEVGERVATGQIEAALPLVFGDVATAGYKELVGGLPLLGIGLSTRVEQVPNPDSRISLAAERDALGMRRAQLDWRLTDLDKHSAVRAMELLGAELGRTGLGRLRIDAVEGPQWPADLTGGWHQMGTTRMSDDPTTGVVDRDQKVFGTDNLYIAGSSVFTTAGSGTPTMTIVALTLRLVDHLKAQLT